MCQLSLNSLLSSLNSLLSSLISFLLLSFMNTDFTYYIYILVAIIVGIFIIKKVASCLFRTVAILAIVAALAAIYYYCFATH